MSTAGDDLVYGWRQIAQVAGCSQRHVRDLVTARQIVTTRRADGAVGVRRGNLLAIAEELGRGHGDEGAEEADASEAHQHDLPALPSRKLPALRVVPEALDAEPDEDCVAMVDGDVAALVFAAFDAEQTPVEVVISTKRAPGEIESLYASWLRLKSIDLSSPAAGSRLAQLEAAVSDIRAHLDTIATANRAVSDPISWAAPRWLHDGIANRVTIVERALLARGILVRNATSTADS